MNIDSIQNGVVIDHITVGLGMKLYELLDLASLVLTIFSQSRLGPFEDAEVRISMISPV